MNFIHDYQRSWCINTTTDAVVVLQQPGGRRAQKADDTVFLRKPGDIKKRGYKKRGGIVYPHALLQNDLNTLQCETILHPISRLLARQQQWLSTIWMLLIYFLSRHHSPYERLLSGYFSCWILHTIDAFDERNVPAHYCGTMSEVCRFCGARYWKLELNS